MKILWIIAPLLILSFACRKDGAGDRAAVNTAAREIEFDPGKWKVKKGRDYPFRDSLLNVLIDERLLKPLDEAGIVELLGPPERVNEGYMYYMVAQRRLVNFWPLHTKMLVVKLGNDTTENLILIHE